MPSEERGQGSIPALFKFLKSLLGGQRKKLKTCQSIIVQRELIKLEVELNLSVLHGVIK